jgi:hypothetical protein
MFKRSQVLGFVLLFVASGCSDSGDGSRCVVGQSIVCACSNGSMGAQSCEDGSRYSACSCDPSTMNPGNRDLGMNPSGGKRIFVTRTSYDGKMSTAFTGDNIDQLCQTAADGAALGGTFVSWAVSPAGVLPISRLTAQGPWYALDGTLLFNNKENLKTTPMNPIELDEFKQACQFCEVWTGLTSGGVAAVGCYYTKYWNDNSSSGSGRAGSTSATDSSWIDKRDADCRESKHLICVEN